MALNLEHASVEQYVTGAWERIRSAWENGDKIEFGRLIWTMYQHVVAGDITSNQARLGFNVVFERSLNNAQWTAQIVPRLTTIKDRYQAMLDETAL